MRQTGTADKGDCIDCGICVQVRPTGIDIRDGGIENSYTLKLINMEAATRQFRIGVRGLPGLRIEGATQYVAEPGRVHTVTLTLSSPLEGMPSGVQSIAFETVAVHDPSLAVRENSTFILPSH